MTYTLLLNDSTRIELKSATNISNLNLRCGISDIADVLLKLTPSNLSHVKVLQDEGVVGEYENLKLTAGTYELGCDFIDIVISLREKSEMEIKVDNIEISQKQHENKIKELEDIIKPT